MPDEQADPRDVRCNVGVMYTIWQEHEERLAQLKRDCPHVSLGGQPYSDSPRKDEHKSRDDWGCLWHYPGRDLDGQVIEHPLDDWDKLDSWQPPSAAKRVAEIRKKAEDRTAEQEPESAGLEHGFLFLRLTYLRGFENFMVDVAERDPRIYELRDIVADYWYQVTEAYLDCGATHINAADDLGLQDRLPIAPDAWRDLIKPPYADIFGLARQRGYTAHLHTDGYIVDIIPDLIEVGVTDLNPQDLVNGLDNLVRLAKGKCHISLDIDRQNITAFGTPAEVDAHIETCIRTLGSPQGGLSLIWGVYHGTPIDNIEAAVRAMQKYHDMWVE